MFGRGENPINVVAVHDIGAVVENPNATRDCAGRCVDMDTTDTTFDAVAGRARFNEVPITASRPRSDAWRSLADGRGICVACDFGGTDIDGAGAMRESRGSRSAMQGRRGRRNRSFVGSLVVGSLVLGAFGFNVPSARADTFCDLSPTAEGVGIDFGRPLTEIRSSATARLPFFQKIAKFLPADTPKSVHSLYAGNERIVAAAAKVTTTKQAQQLARQSFALNTSASGRTAVKWITGRCAAPDTIEIVSIAADTKVPKTTTPPTRPANPARQTAPASAQAPLGKIDPCSVITRRDATQALGADPGSGDATPTPAGGQCSYGTDGGGIILNIVKGPSALGTTAKEAITHMNASALASKANDAKGDIVYDTLPGIGDGAFVIGTGSSPDKAFTSASLAFYTGDTLVTILLSFHPATRNPISQVTNLAKAVAPLTPR